jgi:uncharacterized protein (DUF2252 family)
LWGHEQADEAYNRLRVLLRSYRRTLQGDRRHLLEDFELIQVARKVVGVGSVGTRAWILLLQGIDASDPLFLQAKEAQASVLSGFIKSTGFNNQGQRVVIGQHLMQAASDIFLGWQRAPGPDGVERDYYLHQLRDGKGSVVVEALTPRGMTEYGRICGQTLARAHARSGDRVAIAAYLGSKDRFDHAMTQFAEAYADLNANDQERLAAAVSTGRIQTDRGV